MIVPSHDSAGVVDGAGMAQLIGPVVVALVGRQRVVDGRLEAAHVLDGLPINDARVMERVGISRRRRQSCTYLRVDVARTGLEVFVQRGEDLRVEHLEAPDAVAQPLQRDALDDFVLVVDALHAQNVVAKVQALEPAPAQSSSSNPPSSPD